MGRGKSLAASRTGGGSESAEMTRKRFVLSKSPNEWRIIAQMKATCDGRNVVVS